MLYFQISNGGTVLAFYPPVLNTLYILCLVFPLSVYTFWWCLNVHTTALGICTNLSSVTLSGIFVKSKVILLFS